MVVGLSWQGYTSTVVVPSEALVTDIMKPNSLKARDGVQTGSAGQKRCYALTSLQIMSNDWHFCTTPRNERALAGSRNPHDCNEYIGGTRSFQQHILFAGYGRLPWLQAISK